MSYRSTIQLLPGIFNNGTQFDSVIQFNIRGTKSGEKFKEFASTGFISPHTYIYPMDKNTRRAFIRCLQTPETPSAVTI